MPLDDLHARWRARLSLGFERRGVRTVLARRDHDGPLVVQKALHPEGAGVCHAIVVHPPAGIAAGDELSIEVDAAAGSHALLATPGAARWYRSGGRRATQRVRIEAHAGSTVEWLPQENIVFDGAIAGLSWEAHLAPDARLVAWDFFCLGRTGSGERFTAGECRVASRLYRGGRLAWRERGAIAPGGAAAECAAGLGAHVVFGTMIVAAPRIEDAWLGQARALLPHEGEGAVTRLPGVLLARYRGDSTAAAREWFVALWSALREPVLGVAAAAPRIWST